MKAHKQYQHYILYYLLAKPDSCFAVTMYYIIVICHTLAYNFNFIYTTQNVWIFCSRGNFERTYIKTLLYKNSTLYKISS